MSNGANANASDKKGETPLICSASGLEEPNIALTKLLLEKGADITKKDKSGKTALFSGIYLHNKPYSLKLNFVFNF